MTPEFDKDHYKELKKLAVQHKVNTFVYKCDDHYFNIYNGFTVAYSPATELDDNRMLEVSVSYCAPEDEFKKKIGKYHALRKFFEENNFIHLPLGQYLKDNGTAETEIVLSNVFLV